MAATVTVAHVAVNWGAVADAVTGVLELLLFLGVLMPLCGILRLLIF